MVSGIATIEPPKSCGLYVVRVPKCGPDNNELGTLRLPDITVPIGTYTSWNLRSRSLGAEEELLGLSGGFIPFSPTKTDREQRGDPRTALLERFTSFEEYRRQALTAAKDLIQQRYWLAEDLPRYEQLITGRKSLWP